MSSTVARLHGPPAELTSLLGRRREVSLTVELLEQHGLVTLTGEGGIGKTRLAIRIGHELGRGYPGRVWFAELAEITTSELVVERVAVAMGLQPVGSPEQLYELVIEYAEQIGGVLILDNCEHVIDGASKLADRFRRTGSRVRILATSREALDVAGERLVRLHGLPVRSDKADGEATELFMQRAVAGGLSPAGLDRATIAKICERLDGIPLAIELAAARMRVLSAHQILERLDDPIRLLRVGGSRATARHRTIESSIDWSYRLCSAAEQRSWSRCTLFRGGFNLAAAEAVCADPDVHADELVDAIEGLVTKSVLTAVESTGAMRYHMVHTIRSFGEQHLAEHHEQEIWRRRHRDWLIASLARAESEYVSLNQSHWLQFLKDEELNLAAAFGSAIDAGDDAETLFALSVPLINPRWLLGHGSLLSRLRTALARPGPVTAARLTAQARLASMSMVIDGKADTESIERVWRQADEHGAARARLWAILAAAQAAMGRREFDRTDRLLKLALAEHDGQPDELWGSLLFATISLHSRTGDWERLRRDHALMREKLGPTGETQFQERAIVVLAGAAYRAGHYDEAASFATEALTTARNAFGPVMVGNTLGILAGVELERRNIDRAQSLLLASEATWRDIGSTMTPYLGTRNQIHDAFRARLGSDGYDALLAAITAATSISLDQARNFALGRDRQPESPELDPEVVQWNRLTTREREVARLIADGLTNRQIAERLVVSIRTAEGHVAGVTSKLRVGRRTAVAAFVHGLPDNAG